MEITRPYPLNKDGQNKGGKQTKNDEEARQSLLGDNSTKKSGWGLGLSLCQRIINEVHKGSIYILESNKGAGTVFEINIPSL